MLGILGTSQEIARSEQPSRTWHVSPDGQDSSEEASPEKPLRTIAAALRRVQPGGTVLLAPGTYEGGVVLPPGKPGQPITLRAEKPGRTFIGRPPLLSNFKPAGGYTWVTTWKNEPEMLTELTTNSILRRLSTPTEVRELSGSWCYDKSTQRLTVHATDSGNATTHLFLPSSPTIGITLANHTRVEGLAISGFGTPPFLEKKFKTPRCLTAKSMPTDMVSF